MTRADLITEIRDYLDEDNPGFWSAPLLNRIINRVYRDEALDIRYYYIKDSTITTTDGQKYTDLPSDCIVVNRIYDSDGIDLYPCDSRDFDPVTEDEPTGYEIFQNRIYWNCPPDSAYTLNIRYHYLPVAFTQNTDVVDFPIGYEDVIVLGCVLRCQLKDEGMMNDVNYHYLQRKSELRKMLQTRQVYESQHARIGNNYFGKKDV